MATYVIGDIHGCFRTFLELLRSCEFDAQRDRLWFVGDLVNKGPESLGVLRWIMEQDSRVVVTLGNHDLHLLGRYYGVRKAKPTDNLDQILEANDVEDLLDWLVRRPLIHRENRYVLVHAGILPAWNLDQAARLAERTSRRLVSNSVGLLDLLNDKEERNRLPAPDESITESWVARILTGIRICRGLSDPDIEFAGPPGEAPEGASPWYQYPVVTNSDHCFLFGHWARHGFLQTARTVCLDTACVYGGVLTALRLEDMKVYQVPYCEGKKPI